MRTVHPRFSGAGLKPLITLLWASLALGALGACQEPSPSQDTADMAAPDQGTDPGDLGMGGEADSADQPDGEGGQSGPVFLTVFEQARITSDSSQENFHRIEAEVDWGQQPVARAVLVVDLGTTCFPFEGWRDNPPPEGHNFPANCDAFDRNFEWTLDEPQQEGEPPALELVRAITPFGGPLHLEVDITDLVNSRPGAHRLTCTIPTWSDGSGQVSGANGGWDIDAQIILTPGQPRRSVLGVVPLINHNYGSQTQLAPIPFTVPEGTTEAKLYYRTTGHGGATDPSGACIGPAEEFCRRTHRIFLDGEARPAFIPWRNDCDQLCDLTHYGPEDGGFDYCAQNPMGALESVRAPRANWCPGDVTPPQIYTLALEPGEHSFHYEVEDVFGDGIWRTSAAITFYGP